jgi:predicted transcriptional regulator
MVYSGVNALTSVRNMETQEDGIEKLFFELASGSRLNILREVNKQDRKMSEITRKLNLTTTEAFRQLHRLNEALLIQKKPDGTFGITEFGRFVLQLSASFEVVFKHRQYFATHDLRRLPYQFLNRIGELNSAFLLTDTMENINIIEQLTKKAEQYMWGGGPEQPLNLRPTLRENAKKGATYRFLFPKRFIASRKIPETSHAVEWRSMEDLPVTIILTEKGAGVCFPLIGGKPDYVGFGGRDPIFMNWVKDLFLFYWDKGQRT